MAAKRRKKKSGGGKLLIVILLLLAAAGLAVWGVSALTRDIKPAWEGGYSVSVSEVMTDNDVIPDDAGVACDWVELRNTSSSPFDLAGYGLSDQEGKVKYVFPAGTVIPAEGFLVVWCDPDREEGCAPFALKKEGGETVYLTTGGGVVLDQALTVPCAPGQSLVRDGAGALVPADVPTPGYPNDAEGIAAYLAAAGGGSSGELRLSEIMSSNSRFPAPDGGCHDWIEIHNPTDHAVSLAGYKLSDREEKTKYEFSGGVLDSGAYLVIWSGPDASGDYAAPFALAGAGGETVVLTGPGGAACDSVILPALDSNVSFAFAGGSWAVSERPTPGFANDEAGYAAYIAADGTRAAELYITEVVIKNLGSGADSDGDLSDWIELANLGDSPVSLGGWHLSDDEADTGAWTFPDVTLESGEYLRIFASGKNRTGGELHTSFALSAKETVYLTTPTGAVLRSVSLADIPDGESLAMQPDGGYALCAFPTPGMANTADSYMLLAGDDERSSPLLIWEAAVYDEKNGDWVELKNVSGAELDLSGYYITDNLNKTEKYQLLSGVLAPGQVTVVNCESFGLSAQSDSLYLCSADGKLLDWCFLRQIPLGGSYGRTDGENGFFYFTAATPGAANGAGWRMVAAVPAADTPAGVYDDAESLTVTLSGEAVHYTTDGSTPTEQSPVYTGPITVSKTAVIRARSLPQGQLPSATLTLSYFLRENSSLPIVSLVTDSENLFGARGIYSSHERAWENEWEREATLSFFEEDGSFTIDCGIKIHGRTSRRVSEKRSFGLKFRGHYGGELNYDVFGDGVVTSFQSLLLRAAVEDMAPAYLRDVLFADMAMDFTRVPAQNYRFVTLFINGEYWGVYAIREHHNDNYFAAHYGVDADTVECFNGEYRYPGTFSEVLTYAENHYLGGQAEWEYIKAHVDVEEMIDWLILECWGGDYDVYENVRFYSSPQYEDGRVLYGLVDMDLTLMYHDTYAVGFERWPQLHAVIPRGLLSNAEFKDMFLTRLGALLQNELSDAAVLERLDRLRAIVEPETARDLTRWGQGPGVFAGRVDNMRNFIDGRAMEMVNSARGYFGLNQEQMARYFGSLAQ